MAEVEYDLRRFIDEVESLLKDGTYGLSTLKTLIDAVAAKLEDAMQKATGPAWNQDTDSLEAIREICDSIVTAMT